MLFWFMVLLSLLMSRAPGCLKTEDLKPGHWGERLSVQTKLQIDMKGTWSKYNWLQLICVLESLQTLSSRLLLLSQDSLLRCILKYVIDSRDASTTCFLDRKIMIASPSCRNLRNALYNTFKFFKSKAWILSGILRSTRTLIMECSWCQPHAMQ